MNRREFLRTAGGAAGGTAVVSAAGPASAAEDGGGSEFDYGGWFSDVSNFDGTEDMTGQSEVTVQVGAEGNTGNFAFAPAAIHVDPGTTVVWEWTGMGSQHNVVTESGADFQSDLSAEEGFTYEQTLSEEGIVKYYCNPHLSLGMKGAVVVGDPSAGGGESTPINPEHMGVPFQAHFVGLATILAIVVSLLFTFFLLKYGESANTKGGNN